MSGGNETVINSGDGQGEQTPQEQKQGNLNN